jgi:hypothetical protein
MSPKKSQMQQMTAQPIVEPGSNEKLQLDGQLTDYIRAHTIKVSPGAERSVSRSLTSILLMPFLYTVGAVVFVFGTLFSLAVGRRERRTNKKIWDAAGLPILASDAEDIEARKHS